MEVINGTLRMRGDRILVRPLDWEPSRIIVAIRKGDPVKGVIVAVGPGIHPVSKRIKSRDGKQTTIHFAKRFQPTEVKVDDVIHLGGLNIFDGQGYKFPKVVVNGEVLLICTERDVAAVEQGCEICGGTRGCTKGNENVITYKDAEVVICDACSADHMRWPGFWKDQPSIVNGYTVDNRQDPRAP